MSEKTKLIKFICEQSELELLFASNDEEESLILDESLEHLVLISSSRYGVQPVRIPKSFQMVSTFLSSTDDTRFKRSMRMSKQIFYQLLLQIEDHLVFKETTKKQIPVPVQLAVCLYRFGIFGNGASVQNVARIFGISDGGAVLDITQRVTMAILSLQNKFICWPNELERNEISNLMRNEKLPFCVGFIDGTHIILHEKAEDDPADYINRKNQSSIQLQLTVDHNKIIRHLFVGFPGSVHDARVYSYSQLSKNPGNFFSTEQYLIGDAAYPLSERMITPFRRQGGLLNDENKKFNKHISRHRVRVEHANGILKKRFGSLNGLRLRINRKQGHKNACNWITACCILYNYLLSVQDEWDDEEYGVDDREEDEEALGSENADRNLAGINKRKELQYYILNQLVLV